MYHFGHVALSLMIVGAAVTHEINAPGQESPYEVPEVVTSALSASGSAAVVTVMDATLGGENEVIAPTPVKIIWEFL